MVGLWERKDHAVGTYSGGMRRRLEIARGLMHSPRVLFLDEPTIGLDPQTRRSIWSYIRELKEREEITIFMTTHYMDEAEWCDRIAIMDHGEIVALDDPEALKAEVGTDRVTIHTDDNDAAIKALAERFGIEARITEGAVTFGVPAWRGVRSAAVRGMGSRPPPDPGRERLPADTRRCVHVLHRHLDPRRRGGSGGESEPPDDAGDARRGPAMSTTVQQPAAEPVAAPKPPVVRVSVPKRSFYSELRAIRIVWRRELIRYRSDRLRMVTTLVQPLLFLFVLGAGLQGLARAGTHGVALKTFIYPGILCISVMFTAMFSAASIVWDREFGFLREMMVAPVRRSSIVIGKVPRRRHRRVLPGRDRDRARGLGPRAVRPVADSRHLRPAAGAGVRDHGVRRDDRGADQADAVVHGRHADGRDAAVLHLRRPVPGRRAPRLADGAEPARPAHLRGRPDAPAGLQPLDDLTDRAPRARSGDHLVGLARPGIARGRR